jgi:hypothetical protein
LKNPGLLLVTRNVARCVAGSNQDAFASHRSGLRLPGYTARTVTAPSLPTVTTLDSQ